LFIKILDIWFPETTRKQKDNNVVDRIRLNEHKRRTAMLIRVSEKSFMEWRMPITNRFKGQIFLLE